MALGTRPSPRPVRRISPAALDALRAYPWPGNVRELRSVIQRAVLLGASAEIGLEDLPADIASGRAPSLVSRPSSLVPGPLPAAVLVGQSIDDVERELILRTLESTAWNKTEAARILRVTARTLRNKLARYQLQGYLHSRPVAHRLTAGHPHRLSEALVK